jgi:hypothetical protein
MERSHMVKSVAAVVVPEEQVLVEAVVSLVAMELEYHQHGALLK